MARLSRRGFLGAIPAVGAGAVLLGGKEEALAQHAGHSATPGAGAASAAASPHAGHTGTGHARFRGTIDARFNGFTAHDVLRDFDRGRVIDGVREWTLVAEDKEIEVAPGVRYQGWAYNGRIPGPTLRATEGERLRIRFVNASAHPHTIHFHGIHTAAMDGIPGAGDGIINPGGSTVYEFDATPPGLHLYHCHVRPLAEHIGKGLYGAFIIDHKDPRPKADEMVMVMNAFDTNFDGANEVYAVNTIGFEYMDQPVVVKKDELVRVYLVNVTEFDPINSFHLHANFFDYYPTGTRKEPTEFTDIVMQCQGQRGILEMRFPYTGKYMFHAHQSEFAELGWQGFFEVVE
jgi:FtsP/CotA-like multicopper oxidase with cupredoxin domain